MPSRPPTLAKAFGDLKTDYRKEYRADYAAATPSRFRRTRYGLYGSADSHYASEAIFIRTREYVRDMDRNDAVIGQITDRAVDNQVQGGFTPKPNTGDVYLDADLLAEHEGWALDPDQCDVTGERNFAEIEHLITRAEILDGDIFALPLDEGSLQLVEAHRCRTPSNTKLNVVHGVKLDPRRRPLQYWFCPDNLNPYDRFEHVADATKIEARDLDGEKQVFHCYAPTRVSQTRGVTAFHAVFDICGMLEDTNFAVLVKQQMAACLTAFLQRNGDFGSDPQTGTRDIRPIDDSTSSVVDGISPGQFIRGAKGEELKIQSPNIPSSEFFEHIRLLLSIIGANIGLPLVMVLMDARETNFSGWRAAMDQAKLGFRCRQERRKARFYNPVWKWRIRQLLAGTGPGAQALRNAAKKQTINIFRHEWQAPGWPYIQPLHDAQADVLRLTNLLTSPTRLHAEDGDRFTDILREAVRDNGQSIEQAIIEAKRIGTATGVKVAWQDVLNRQLPKGTQLVETLDEAQAPGSGAQPGNSPVRRQGNN